MLFKIFGPAGALLLAVLLLLGGCSYKHSSLYVPGEVKKKAANDTFYSYGKTDVGTQLPKSGFYPLSSPLESLAARVLLMQNAQKSIDLQYYLIEFDEVGALIFKSVLDAADRGVKVRMLLDDILLSGRDERLAMLAAHKNIEIRVFNPTYFRGPLKYLEMAFRSDSVGRRMHIKSFNVDNSAIILGGRNLQNIYFAADAKHVYLDNDILCIGPMASQLTYEFDTYWNSVNVYKLSEISGEKDGSQLDYLRKKAVEFFNKHKDSTYVRMAKETEFSKEFTAKALDLTFAEGTIYYDDATKVSTDAGDKSRHLLKQLEPIILKTKKSLRIINPYFVPNDNIMAFFKMLRAKGVEIYILTNSLPSADAPFVYAFYKQYQKPLLKLGVHLYEVKSSGLRSTDYSRKYKEARGHFLSVQLHAKTMLIDDETLIIGSMNLDPRSIYLNAEIVGVIDSRALAARVKKQLFDVAFDPQNAFELKLECIPPYKEVATGHWIDNDTQIVWISREGNHTVRYYDDAGASFWKRFMANMLYFIPIGGTI